MPRDNITGRKYTSRRSVLKSAGAGTLAVGAAGLAGCLGDDEGDYPNERIRVIVPFSEGGGTDVYARQIMPALSEELDVDIQIDNIPGAASLRGTGELYNADPDGYTIGLFNPPSTPVSALVQEPDFDLRDLEGICAYGRVPYVLFANAETGIETTDELVEAYETGELTNIAGQQMGGLNHLIKMVSRDWLPWETYVPYDGSGPVMQAVISGEAPAGSVTPDQLEAPADAGDVNVISSLSSEGTEVFDIPTTADEGYPNIDYLAEMRRCMWFPPDTDDELGDVIREGMEAAIETDRVQEWSEETGNDVGFQNGDVPNQMLDEIYEEIPQRVDLDAIREAAE